MRVAYITLLLGRGEIKWLIISGRATIGGAELMLAFKFSNFI